jgi:hypothetical protein
MADPFEVSPEALRTATELVEMARENTPDKLTALKQKIGTVDNDTFEQFAKKIEEQKIALNNEIREGLRERAARLTNLETRLRVLKQLGIPEKSDAPKKSFSEQVKSGVASLPGLFGKGFDLIKTSFGKGFDAVKNLRGRDVKRGALIAISFIEKAPGVLVSLITGGGFLSSFANFIPSFNFANRKLAEMDIEDTIAKNKKEGETIEFSGISSAEFTAFQALEKLKAAKGETVPVLADLVKNYIELQRKNAPGQPIRIRLSELQSMDELKAKVAEKETADKATTIATSLNLSDVRFDETKTSIESGILYASTKDIEGNAVRKGSNLEKLLEIRKQLPSATSIVLAETNGIELSWTGSEKIARVSPNTAVSLTSAETLLAKPAPSKFNTILMKNGGRALDTITYTLTESKDLLTVPNNPQVLKALEDKLEAIPFTGIDLNKGATWKLINGEFVPESLTPLNS